MNNRNKQRIITLLLAASLTLTSGVLTSCKKNKGPYATKEKEQIYEEIEEAKEKEEWFCTIFVEDYNDNVLEGAEFLLTDEENNIIDTWISTKKAHTLTNLENKIYILKEVSPPKGYIITGNNTWIINPKSGYKKEVLAIKNIKEKEYQSNNVYNILNTGKKENIDEEYFVLRIKESYENRQSKRDHLEYKGKLPNYILLKGTKGEVLIPEYSSTIEYEFNDVISGISYDNTNVVLTYNGDGSYNILLYRTYLGLKGKLTNTNLYIEPLEDLTKEELKCLEEEHQNYEEMLNKINNTPKTKKLTK